MNPRIYISVLVTFALPGLATALTLTTAPSAAAQALYVSNLNSGIVKLSNNGTASQFAMDPGSGTVLNRSYGLAFDNSGNLYVANEGPINQGKNFITRFDKNGVATRFADTTTQPGSMSAPRGMAFDGNGNLFVANYGSNTIERFNIATGLGTVFASSALQTGSLNGPVGLAFDSKGSLYVANQFSNTIERFNALGVGTVFASDPGGTVLSGPVGMAFDGAGNLFVSNQDSYTIEKYDPNGNGTLFSTSNTFPVIRPLGLAFDSANSLYATASYGNQAQSIVAKYSSGGIGARFDTGLVTGLDAPRFLAFAPAAAPEPSAVAGLALGAVTLSGLALRARKTQKGRCA